MADNLDLQKLVNELEAYYSPWRNRVHRWRGIYYRSYRNLPQLPEGVPIHESSKARIIVDNLADQIRTDEPRVVFNAMGTSLAAQSHKELMETWGGHVMRHIPRHVNINPFEQVKKDLLRDSAACIKFTIDMDALPEPPAKGGRQAMKDWRIQKANAWVFDVRALDPLSVMPCPGRRSPAKYYIEVQDRLAIEVKDDYPHWSDPKRPAGGMYDSPLRIARWVEYWDDVDYKVMVDGDIIIDKHNPYDASVYIWSYNGLGRADSGHYGLGSAAYLSESVLEAAIGELEAEVRVKTAMDAQWQFHVFPRLITTKAAEVARREFMKGPGSIIHVDTMQDAPQWLDTPEPNAQMFQFLEHIENTINSRFPAAINQRPEGVEAAIHQALLQGQAIRPLQPIKDALNHMASGLLNGLARQMVALNISMNVFGMQGRAEKTRMVSAEDMISPNFDVRFEATDPAEDDRKLLTGVSLLRVPGLLSRQTFREKFAAALGLRNDEEEARTLKEATLDQAAQSGLLLQAAMEEMAAMEQEEQAKQVAGVLRKQVGEQAVPGERERGMGEFGAAPPPEIKQAAQEQLEGV